MGSRSYRHRFQSQGSIDKESSGFSRLIRRLKRNKIHVKNNRNHSKKQRVKKDKLKQKTTPYYQSFLETSKIVKVKSRSNSKNRKTKVISQRQSTKKSHSKKKRKDNQRMTVNQNKKYHSSSKSQNSISHQKQYIKKVYNYVTPVEKQLKSNEKRIIHLTKSLSQRNFSNNSRILQIKRQITRKRSKKKTSSSKKKKIQSKSKQTEFNIKKNKSIFQKKKSALNIKNKIKDKKQIPKLNFSPFLEILKTFESIINHFKELNGKLNFEIFKKYLIGNYPFFSKNLFTCFDIKRKKKLQQTYAKEILLFSYGYNFLKKFNDSFQLQTQDQKELLKSQFYDEKNKNNDTNSKSQILRIIYYMFIELYFVALSRISIIIEKFNCCKSSKSIKLKIIDKISQAEKNYGIKILNQDTSKKLSQMENIIKDLMNMMGQLLLFFQTQQKNSIKEFAQSFKQKVQDAKKYSSHKIYLKDWQQLLDYFEIVLSQQEIMMFDTQHMDSLLNFDLYFFNEIQKQSDWINLKGPFLPPINPKWQYTLVVDLDETLIYFPDSMMENFEQEVHKSLLIRPHALKFLHNLSQYYEIVIFTAATQDYADLILDIIDQNNIISHRLYQQHISMVDNLPIKDLSQLGRDLSKIIIIEDTPSNYSLQKDNGLHVKQWKGDKTDQCFLWLELVLTTLVQQQPNDMRTLLKGVKETLVAEQLIIKILNNILLQQYEQHRTKRQFIFYKFQIYLFTYYCIYYQMLLKKGIQFSQVYYIIHQ